MLYIYNPKEKSNVEKKHDLIGLMVRNKLIKNLAFQFAKVFTKSFFAKMQIKSYK